MDRDPPKILSYAAPIPAERSRPSATLFFAGGVAVPYFLLMLLGIIQGDFDILLGPLAGCIVVPGITAAIFHAAAAVRRGICRCSPVQRNSWLTFWLGVAAFVLPLIVGALVDNFGPSQWAGAFFLIAALISPMIAALAAFEASNP